MDLNNIYEPIQNDILLVEQELRSLAKTFAYPQVQTIVDYFFKMPGKYLRSALVLLSALAVGTGVSPEKKRAVILTAVGAELIHNASLVHDDILDEDKERRGQPTVNHKWGNKVALLAGDTMYSRAFGILVGCLSAGQLQRMVQLNETMCNAEIENEILDKKRITVKQYLEIIEGKTARFMSLCCRLGAELAGADEETAGKMEEFGLNFGMAFQLFDDHNDKDIPDIKIDLWDEAKNRMDRAIKVLSELKPTMGTEKLADLSKYFIEINYNS